jgi:hypothetical protein
MTSQPNYQNLSTVFVNVGDLVKYLHSLQFVGRVNIASQTFEGEIVFRPGDRVHALETDLATGESVAGENALRSILKRSKAEECRIDVVPDADDEKPAPIRVFVDEAIVSGARKMAYGFCDTIASSRVAGAVRNELQDREELKEMVLELLKNASAAFQKQRLDFDGLFRNACQINADRYAFLEPGLKSIIFTDGRLYVHRDVSPQQLANGISAVLGYMLLRLRESSELKKLHNFTMHRMRSVISRRQDVRDRMLVRRQFEKLVDY